MKILMLAQTFPLPADRGDKRRIYEVAKRLSRDHNLTLVSLVEQSALPLDESQIVGVTWENHLELLKYSSTQAALLSLVTQRNYREIRFWNPVLQKKIDSLLSEHNWDLIWVNFITMSAYLENWFQRDVISKKPIFLLDQHNIDKAVWRKVSSMSGNPIRRAYATIQYKKMERFQAHWYPKYDKILCVSEEDLEITRKYVDSSTDLILAPNGVDTQYFISENKEKKTYQINPVLLYGGSMDVYMNQDAVIWFVNNILPQVKAIYPEIEFWIIGRNPPLHIRKLENTDGVFVSGTVADVREYYLKADVFVIPSRLGGGTKLKTLEAMSLALPIVSTSTGVQGLKAINGKHLLITDDPKIFSDLIVELLENRDRASMMGREARKFVKENYNWDKIMDQVEDNIQIKGISRS
jgi:sugar transferase (PEP-CTERM/EpsH1 system associated)